MKRFVGWTFFLVCFATGCTTARALHYYRISLAPVAASSNSSPFPVSIIVGRLTAPRILRDDRVVYGMSDVELGVDEYHRWTEAPAEMGPGQRTVRRSGSQQVGEPRDAGALEAGSLENRS